MKSCIPLILFVWSLMAGSHAFGHAVEGPVWPEVSALDVLTRYGSELVSMQDQMKMEQVLPAISMVAEKITSGQMPKKIRRPLEIKLWIEDIDFAVQRMEDAQSLSEYDIALDELSKAIARLMRDAGMPQNLDYLSGRHAGVVSPFINTQGEILGFIELKLHDDKGDLELWLTGLDAHSPFDLPLSTKIPVSFPEFSARNVELRVRNMEQNEDEEGDPTIRNGKTNYFIFPGDSGEDATWLMGKSFRSPVNITFDLEGHGPVTTGFELVPHVIPGE